MEPNVNIDETFHSQDASAFDFMVLTVVSIQRSSSNHIGFSYYYFERQIIDTNFCSVLHFIPTIYTGKITLSLIIQYVCIYCGIYYAHPCGKYPIHL